MKVSQINFNLRGTNSSPQKVSLTQIPQKVNFQRQNQDTFTKSDSFSNEDALKLTRQELQKYMTQEETDTYMKKLEKMCNDLGIEPKNLSINKEHPGNLKDYQRQQMTFLVKEDTFQ